MRKLYISLTYGLCCLFFVFNLKAQPTFTITPQNVTANVGETFTVDVVVTDFTDILSFQYSINWDETVLSFVSLGNFNGNLSGLNNNSFGTPANVNFPPNRITTSWLDANLAGISLNDGSILFSITFMGLADGTTEVLFSSDPVTIEIVDSNTTEIGMTGVSSTVVVGDGGGGGTGIDVDVNFNIGDQSVDPGGQVCVPFSVEGFTDITGFQFSVAYDTDDLEFSSIQNLNLTSLDMDAFGTPGPGSMVSDGFVTVGWVDGQGVTTTDGTVIFEVCFDVIGGAGTNSDVIFSNFPTAIDITDFDENNVNFIGQDGVVSINGNNNNPGSLTMSIEDVTATQGDQICLDVTADSGFENILGLQFSLDYDPAILEFVSIGNFNLDGLNANAFGLPPNGTSPGDITLSWLDNNLNGIDLPDGTVVFEICFDALGSTTTDVAFSGSPTGIEVTDGNEDPVMFTGNDGTVTLSGGGGGNPGDFLLTIDDITANQGDQICLDVTTENFTEILGLQFSINYDETNLQFESIGNFNLDGLNANAFGLPPDGTDPGIITMSWLDNNLVGVSLPDGTVLFELCFTVTGNSTSDVVFSNSPTGIEVTDADENPVDFNGEEGTVTVEGGGGGNPDGFTLIIDDITANQGDQICLDVTTANFTEILGLQFSIDYDPGVLEFESIGNFNLDGLNANGFGLPPDGTDPGTITMSWLDNNLAGISLPDGTVLFEICFNVTGNNTTTVVTFTNSPTGIEVTDANENPVEFNSESGTVTIGEGNGGGGDPEGFTLEIEDVTAEQGDMICLDVTAFNFTNILGLQFSIDYDPAVLEFQSIGNFNLDGLNANAFGLPPDGTDPGVITMSWLDDNLVGVSVPNNTVLFELCFEVVGDLTTVVDFSESPTQIEVTDGDENPVEFNGESGTVTILDIIGPDDFALFIEDVNTETGETICLGVTTQNFDNILGLQFSINYDPDLLQFESVGNFNLDGLNENLMGLPPDGTNPGAITLSWLDENLQGLGVPDGTEIFEICFVVIGDQDATVIFSNSPTGIEVTDGDENPVEFNGDPGIVTLGSDPLNQLALSISTESVNNGEQVCLDVTADSGFENITDLQFSINYNENALTFASVMLGQDLTGLDMSDLSVPPTTDEGIITFDWEDGAPDGVSLNDGTTLFQICFDVDGVPGATIPVEFANTPTDTSANNAIPESVPLDLNNGAVIINNEELEGFHLVMSDVDLCTEDDGFDFCVQVTTNDFTNILGMQFSILYNTSVMELVSIGNFNLDGLLESSFGTNNPGIITSSWLDNDLLGISVPDGTVIFEICFTALVDEAPVSIITFSDSPTLIEITDGNEQPVEFNGIGSVVNISCEPNNNLPLVVTLEEIVDVDCFGESTGAVEVSASGGLAPYTYEWSIPGGNNRIEFLAAGDYDLTVTSSDGQVFMDTYTVDGPASAVTINTVQIVNEPECNGDETGVLAVFAGGGTGALSYTWNPPSVGTAPNPTGLAAGFYRVTVSDQNGCEAVSNFVEITEPDALTVSIGSIQNILCSGSCTGSIDLNITGGTGATSIDWGGDLPDEVTTQNDLCAGAYSVTVTDASGCTTTSNNINVLDLNAPLEVSAITPTYIQNGNDGSITVQATGGAGILSYQWSGPQNPLANAANISNLNQVGEYCVTITDSNGCTTSDCTDLLLALRISDFSINKACGDSEVGGVDITVLGGRPDPAYTFEWRAAGDDMVISTLEDLTGVAAGNYTVTVTDSEGSQVSGNFEITSFPAIEVSAMVTAANNGNDGTIDLDITGGAPGFTVSWDNGDTGEFIDGLIPGQYCATIADANNCFFDTCFIVPAAPLAIQLTPTDVSCNGDENGTITVDIQGGIPSYTVELNGMEVYAGDDNQVFLDGLLTGDYSVKVTDSQGDMVTEMASIMMPDPITFTASVVHDDGEPGCTGSISLFIEGGTGPYTVNWNGNFSGPQIVVCEGNYIPTIIDANNCVVTGESIGVTKFDISQEVVITDVECQGESNGSIMVSIEGGEAPYTFEWLNMSGEVIAMTQNLTDVPAGAYRVRVTEGSGNTIVSEPLIIGTSSELSLQTDILTDFNGYPISCADASDGQIRVSANDAVGEVFYEWTKDGVMLGTEAVLSGASAGTYNVLVSDSGCSIDQLVTIEGPTAMAVNGSVKDVSCSNDKDGEIIAVASGGAAGFGYTYRWSHGDISSQTDGLPAGDYTVTATDANDCTMSNTFTVGEPAPMLVSTETEAATDESCNGMIRIVVNGGSEPYTYDWVNLEANPTSPMVTDLCPSMYQLRVVDANGCVSELAVADVKDRRFPCFEERVVITPEGDGLNDEFMIFCIDDLPDNHLEIYNRWGQLVFEVDDYDNTWEGTTQDGARLPEGPYYYVLDYFDVATGQMTQVKGSLTILRE